MFNQEPILSEVLKAALEFSAVLTSTSAVILYLIPRTKLLIPRRRLVTNRLQISSVIKSVTLVWLRA